MKQIRTGQTAYSTKLRLHSHNLTYSFSFLYKATKHINLNATRHCFLANQNERWHSDKPKPRQNKHKRYNNNIYTELQIQHPPKPRMAGSMSSLATFLTHQTNTTTEARSVGCTTVYREPNNRSMLQVTPVQDL
jgi:hypothetical protein